MVKELKHEIQKEVEKYIMSNLFNHRKKKEGLVSAQNMLCADLIKKIKQWANEDPEHDE